MVRLSFPIGAADPARWVGGVFPFTPAHSLAKNNDS